ncbi:MAG TPA: adenylosuccinate synthetase, partial [Sandaracinaceae bacterium]
DQGERLRQAGGEFGATTGRPRRCGWLDVPVLRHAVRVNGLNELALTKLDVLTGIDPIRVAVAYEKDGARLSVPPSIGLERVTPIYEELPGWSEDLARCRTFEELPPNAQRYVRRIEELVGIPVSLLSLGAERTQTITLADPWR